MYIPEFWCGVIACLLGELALLVGGVIVYALKPNKNDEEDKS